MTNKQFVGICKVMGGPLAACRVINPKHWPDFTPAKFEELAMDIDPDDADKNPALMAEHFRIMEIAQWAKARIA